MSENVIQWHSKIDALTKEFSERFGDLPADELNRKPNAQTWSIAENLQHLISVNESYFPLVAQLKEGRYQTPFLARFGFLVKIFGNTLYKAVEPARRKKIRTFPMWEPEAARIRDTIVPDFIQHQSALKATIASAGDLVAKGVVIASPANRNLVYTLEKAFDILVAHEERHLNQAIEAFETIFQNQYKYDL